jgi:hypothetical protein
MTNDSGKQKEESEEGKGRRDKVEVVEDRKMKKLEEKKNPKEEE